MAGGVFIDRPFNPNTKCVVFAILIALIYAYLPRAASGHANPLIVALIIVLAYIAMAWSDYAYSCSDYMFSGTGPSVHFASIFKPQMREEGRCTDPNAAVNKVGNNRLVSDQEKAYLRKVYIFHTLVVAPLLTYIGYMGVSSHPSVWGFVGGLGALAFIYHGARLKYPREVWK